MEKKYIAIAFVSLLLIAMMVGFKYQSKIDKSNSKLFNQSSLNGIIEEIGIKNHGSYFKLKGVSKVYVFSPIGLSQGHSFSNFATKGDKIIKGAQADTLLLIKDDVVYKYSFYKD